jgi:hypothetical protein
MKLGIFIGRKTKERDEREPRQQQPLGDFVRVQM